MSTRGHQFFNLHRSFAWCLIFNRMQTWRMRRFDTAAEWRETQKWAAWRERCWKETVAGRELHWRDSDVEENKSTSAGKFLKCRPEIISFIGVSVSFVLNIKELIICLFFLGSTGTTIYTSARFWNSSQLKGEKLERQCGNCLLVANTRHHMATWKKNNKKHLRFSFSVFVCHFNKSDPFCLN